MIVERFSTVGEAAAAKTALDAAGIGADLYDEYFIGLDWRYSNGLGGVKVAVSPEDFEEAADILDFEAQPAPDAVEPLLEPELSAAEPSTLLCPECGSDAVSRIPRLMLFGLIALIFLGVGYVLNQVELALAGVAATVLIALVAPSHRCTSCGERWTPPFTEKAEPPLEAVVVPDEHCPHCASS